MFDTGTLLTSFGTPPLTTYRATVAAGAGGVGGGAAGVRSAISRFHGNDGPGQLALFTLSNWKWPDSPCAVSLNGVSMASKPSRTTSRA